MWRVIRRMYESSKSAVLENDLRYFMWSRE